MTFAELVGFSFGVNEKVSLATEERGFGSRSRFGSCSSSQSKIPVKNSESVTTSCGLLDRKGKGNGVTFSTFGGSSSGVVEGVNLSEKEGGAALRNFDLNESGMLANEIKEETIGEAHYNILAQKKKRKNFKRPKLAAVGDPDWSPEQTSCVRSSGAKEKVKSVGIGSKPIRCQNVKSPSVERECVIDTKPIIQSMPDNLKDLLSSSGWMVVFLEGSCHAIHVSPSGSVYGSLPKALEDYFRETSVFKEKQSVPSHLVSGSSPGVAKRPYKRKQVQKSTTTATESMASPQQKSGEENNKESSVLPVGVQSGPSHSVSGSSPGVAKRPYKRRQVQKSITTTTEPMASPQQKSGEENNRESSVLPSGVKSKAVHKVVPFCSEESQENSCIQDKCFNNERKQLDFGSGVARVQSDNGDSDLQKCDKSVEVIKDDFLNHENNNANCSGLEETKSAQNNRVAHRNRKLRGDGRSGRVKGRNVPVVGKLDARNLYFRYDSSNPVDMFTSGTHLNRQEASKKENENKGSSVPQKTRYREVHELMASSTVEEKSDPCISIEGLIPSMTPAKQDTDERNDKESAPIPEELIDVHQVLPSYMPGEKEKSCMKDDCLSKESKRLDWSNELVKNERDEDTNIHQIDELVDVRRSTRINGRHVPVESEMVGMWANDDFMELSISAANSVADKNKDTTICIEGEKFKGGASTTATTAATTNTTTTTMDNTLFKRTSKDKCGHRNNRNKKPLEKLLERIKNENTWENCDEIKTSPVSQKCSLPPKKSLAMGLTKKQSPNASKRKSFGGGYSNGKKNKKRSGGCGLIVRRTGKGDHEETNSYETKVSMLSWLIDSGTLTENEKVVYKIKKGRKRLLKGCVTRGGIRCNCCKKVLSLLEFEGHAGSNIRQPWKITCLTSGKSLLQCQSEAWEKEKKHRKIGFQTVGIGDADPTDDTCGICADGGQLICCDGCPSTFHQECVKLESVPEGIWHCPFCRCAFCLLADCGQDESDGTINLLNCSQCGCKYHRDCILENDADRSSLNSSYCGKYCQKVAAGLSDILGVSNPLGGGFSWSLIRRLDEEGVSSDQRQSSIMECNTKLPLALLVLHECFVPLLDPRSGLDMIVQAVFNCGSNFNRLNYEGFYTAILEKDDSVISVATLRFHGTRLVEMPFIGTRPTYRRQGMCRRLLNAIEEMLSSLHVEKLIIPAIPDMLETWMKSFSFSHLELSHKDEIRKLNMIIFAETTLLQKPLCCERAKLAKETALLHKPLCCERAKLAKDAKQLDLVDGLGKEIDRSHHLLNCDGGHIQVILNCHSSEDGIQGHEVATPGQYEVIEAPISADAASVSLHSEVSNVSIQNVDMLSQNLERNPIPLTPVDIILAEVSVSPKKVSLPNNHVLMSAKC